MYASKSENGFTRWHEECILRGTPATALAAEVQQSDVRLQKQSDVRAVVWAAAAATSTVAAATVAAAATRTTAAAVITATLAAVVTVAAAAATPAPPHRGVPWVREVGGQVAEGGGAGHGVVLAQDAQEGHHGQAAVLELVHLVLGKALTLAVA